MNKITRRILFFVCAVIAIAVLAALYVNAHKPGVLRAYLDAENEPSNYWTDGETVFYVGDGTTTVMGADPHSFTIVSNSGEWHAYDMAKDAQHVYLYNQVLPGIADPASFGIAWWLKEAAMAKDKDTLYSMTFSSDAQLTAITPIANSDPGTLKIIPQETSFDFGPVYAADKNQFYCGIAVAPGISPHATLKSFDGERDGIPFSPYGAFYIVDGDKFFTSDCKPVTPSSFTSEELYSTYVEQLRAAGESI